MSSMKSLLVTSEKHSKLSFSPNELDLVSIVLTICFFVARSILHAIGLGTPFISTRFEPKSGQALTETFALPEISLSMPLKLSTADRRIFAAATSTEHVESLDLDVNNAQLCLYLAAVSEPAMLLLLAKRGCPVRPLGAVNVRNRFELLHPRICRALVRDQQGLSDTSDRESLSAPTSVSVLARFSQAARKVRRGLEIDVEVSIVVDQPNKDTKQSTIPQKAQPVVIFRQEFTMLQFMRFNNQSTKANMKEAEQSTRQSHTNPTTEAGQVLMNVSMSSQAPYIWARLCKDYNPIHLSPIMAKMLGQSGQLAHGNHAVSVCIQSMSQHVRQSSRLSDSSKIERAEDNALKRLVIDRLHDTSLGSQEWWMEVRFRRPVVLPALFSPKLYDDGNEFDIVNEKTGKVSIEVIFG